MIATTTEPLKLRRFDRIDWYGLAGASRFADGSEPWIGEFRFTDQDEPWTVIYDADGVSVWFYNEDATVDQLACQIRPGFQESECESRLAVLARLTGLVTVKELAENLKWHSVDLTP